MVKKQLSEIEIRERIRARMPELIEQALDIAKNGNNDNARISAIRLLMSKCIPDLKSEVVVGNSALPVPIMGGLSGVSFICDDN